MDLGQVSVPFSKERMTATRTGEPKIYVAAGVFFIGYALFQIPSNLILVKVGAPVWLGCMLALWGAVAALCAFITNAAQFMTLRFLLGIAECGAFPGMHNSSQLMRKA